jgi:hypothetical protein
VKRRETGSTATIGYLEVFTLLWTLDTSLRASMRLLEASHVFPSLEIVRPRGHPLSSPKDTTRGRPAKTTLVDETGDGDVAGGTALRADLGMDLRVDLGIDLRMIVLLHHYLIPKRSTEGSTKRSTKGSTIIVG